jgi:hypothetical protein
MMRKPRDLDSYSTAENAVAWLRERAEEIEQTRESHPLVKVRMSIMFWNPAWEKKDA